MPNSNLTRRNFIAGSLAGGGAFFLSPSAFAAEPKEQTEVGPAEDLMREHGGLNRILLIYEEGLRRINAGGEFEIGLLGRSASLIKSFIENYHEKLEEEFVFPRMRKIAKLVDLVNTLETQHKAGRKVTGTILHLSRPSIFKDQGDKEKLVSALQQFIRMYRPHESREDTVLFPAFHASLSEKEYDKLGDQLEDREHKLFGQEGFDGIVTQIEGIEKSLGIYDLSQFTPA